MQQKKITRINTTLVSSPAAAAAVHSSHLLIIHPNASITPITVIIIIPFICIERVKREKKTLIYIQKRKWLIPNYDLSLQVISPMHLYKGTPDIVGYYSPCKDSNDLPPSFVLVCLRLPHLTNTSKR